jgi:putative FmdB family regulatory protein
MPLYEYLCLRCNFKFEQITASLDRNESNCPKCLSKDTKKLISQFAVGGQGDLRESTLHGCHDCEVPPGHSHD